MTELLSVEHWVMKESLMEYYCRELTAGRMPVAREKGVLVEYASIYANNASDSQTGQSIDSKAGKVAIVNVVGVMTRYGEACSYGTEQIANQLKALYINPGVSAIVMKWDTPGGEVNGVKVFGETIKARNKPVVSYVIQADSGGYWGASQTDEIIMEDNAQAEVGSIGVYGVRQNVQKAMDQQGIKITMVRADGSEDKALLNPYEDAPPEAIAQQKKTLNAIRAEFVDVVKAGRPSVDASVFTGKTYKASDAIKLGLADKVGSLQDAINRADFLARKQARATKLGQQNLNNNNVSNMGWLKQFLGTQVSDESMAEQLVDNKVAEMTGQISNLMKQRDEEAARANGLAKTLEETQTQLAAAAPKAKLYEEISAEHTQNKTYIENLKNAGIVLPQGDANGRDTGGEKKSYEAASWNEQAVAMAKK